MNRRILEEIDDELCRQQELCIGENTEEFDKTNSQNDWVAYITSYAGSSSQKVAKNEREKCDFRDNMIKVAALAVSAIRCYDKGYC